MDDIHGITDEDCLESAKGFAQIHGNDCWDAFCEAWGLDKSHSKRMKRMFIAGLKIGFFEAMKTLRDMPEL